MIHPASFTKTQFGFQSQQELKIEQTWVLAYVYVCCYIHSHTATTVNQILRVIIDEEV